MPSNWSTINAPKATSVSAAGLAAAIAAARPGEVITVTAAGAPLDLTISAVKAGYGVCILLPANQLITAVFTAAATGLHFFGGTWGADTVRGTTTSSNNGVDIEPGCAKLSWHGALIAGNYNGFLGTEANDLWLRDCIGVDNRADHIHFSACNRVAVEDDAFLPGAGRPQFCYYNNGDPPTEGESSSACTSLGGIWEDAPHNDVCQALPSLSNVPCTDFIFQRVNAASYLSQGFVTFGTTSNEIQRALIADNIMTGCHAWGIQATGTHIEIRDNVVADHADATVPSNLAIYRGTGTTYARGGRNTAPDIINPSGVDLGSATINGDTVTAPERPRIILPPWAPAVPTPTAPAPTVPVYRAGGGIRYHGTLAAGTWLSINRGSYMDREGTTWAYRWRLNGTLIGGATTQVVQAQTGTMVAEVMGTNDQGAGAWNTHTAVVVP